MSVDLRGFRYELAPLAQLEASRLQTAELCLADATTRARQGEAALQQARDAVRRFIGELASERVGETLDVSRKLLTTRYVAELHRTVARMEARAARLEAERKRALDDWVVRKRRVEQIDAHREDAALEYVRARSASEFRQADDDWLLRAGARICADEDGDDDDRV